MKKLSNKILVIVLLALAAIFVLSKVFRSGKRESNLRSELVSVDSARVTEIKIKPKANEAELTLVREGISWKVKNEKSSAWVERGSVNGALGYLVKLKPMRLITNKKDKWNEYQVGDSSTQVKVFEGKNEVASLRIGKIGFMQGGGNPYGGGAFTYVRVGDEEEVYSVEGFLESAFNRDFNDWRNKSFLRLKTAEISKIIFAYPDSGFVAEKKDNRWWIGNQQADSVKITSYLSQMEYKNASAFADDFIENELPHITIRLEGQAGPVATVQGWMEGDDWVLASTEQTGVYFSSKGSGLVKTIFVRKKNLISEK